MAERIDGGCVGDFGIEDRPPTEEVLTEELKGSSQAGQEDGWRDVIGPRSSYMAD